MIFWIYVGVRNFPNLQYSPHPHLPPKPRLLGAPIPSHGLLSESIADADNSPHLPPKPRVLGPPIPSQWSHIPVHPSASHCIAHPSESQCISVHPSASQCIPVHPSACDSIRLHQTPSDSHLPAKVGDRWKTFKIDLERYRGQFRGGLSEEIRNFWVSTQNFNCQKMGCSKRSREQFPMVAGETPKK